MSIRQQSFCCKFWLRTVCFVASLLLFSTGATAQDSSSLPKYSLFGGVSYMRFDGKKLGFEDYTDLAGLNGEASVNLWRKFGAVADVSGEFGTDQRVYHFLVGPQYAVRRWSKLTLYGRGFYGRTRDELRIQHAKLGGTVSGRYLSIGRALGGGGAADYDYSPRLTFRVQVDYLRGETFSTIQNNLRVSGGLVWHFGSK